MPVAPVRPPSSSATRVRQGIPHLFFDLDGTLTNPFDGISRCLLHALRTLDREEPHADILRSCIGPPLRRSFSRLMNTDDSELVEKAVAIYRERYFTSGLYENEPYAGVDDMLARLHAAGHRLFVVTSKLLDPAERIIEHFGLAPYFECVYGSDPAGTLDDKADLIAHVLNTEAIAASECIMIGDRVHDVEAAHRNGVRAVGVTWGFGSIEELAGADALCDGPSTLPPTVLMLSNT